MLDEHPKYIFMPPSTARPPAVSPSLLPRSEAPAPSSVSTAFNRPFCAATNKGVLASWSIACTLAPAASRTSTPRPCAAAQCMASSPQRSFTERNSRLAPPMRASSPPSMPCSAAACSSVVLPCDLSSDNATCGISALNASNWVQSVARKASKKRCGMVSARGCVAPPSVCLRTQGPRPRAHRQPGDASRNEFLGRLARLGLGRPDRHPPPL